MSESSPLAIQSQTVRSLQFRLGKHQDSSLPRRFEAKFMVRHLRILDNPDLLGGLEFRLVLNEIPASEPSAEEASPKVDEGLNLDYWVRYGLFEPLDAQDRERLSSVLYEAELRTRLAVADFAFNCGGDQLRALIVDLMRKILRDEELTIPGVEEVSHEPDEQLPS